MEVRILRLDQCFSNGPPGDTVAPHTSLAKLLELLDPTSRAEVLKFRFLDDARRCLLGRILVRCVLSEQCQVSHDSIELDKTPQGRPFAVHPSFPSFPIDYNISHDANLVVIATVPKEGDEQARIGIDVMRFRNPWDGTSITEFVGGIAAQVRSLYLPQRSLSRLTPFALSEQLTELERTHIDSLSNDDLKLRHVLALWTLKEAYVKATGQGLHCDLSQVEFDLDLNPSPSSGNNGRETIVVGRASFGRARLEGWAFDLFRFGEIDAEYFVAVARNRVEGGQGQVRIGDSTKADSIRVLEFREVVAPKFRNSGLFTCLPLHRRDLAERERIEGRLAEGGTREAHETRGTTQKFSRIERSS